MLLYRGRPKVEIPLSAVTESRPKVTYHIWPKPYVPPKVKRDFRPKTETETESPSCLSRHDYSSQQVLPSVHCPTIPCIWYLSHLAPLCQPCGVSLMTRPEGPTVPVYQMQTQTTQPLPRYSQYTVRLMAPRVWRTLAFATQALWPTFGNHRIYQLQPAETESAPNVVRLLSGETECPPKVPIYPHSAPKLKPKPKFGRPLLLYAARNSFPDSLVFYYWCFSCFYLFRHTISELPNLSSLGWSPWSFATRSISGCSL